MQHIVRILSIALTGILFIHVLSASGQEKQKKDAWKGKLGNGTTITMENLSEIQEQHIKWLKTKGEKGLRADLTRADLSGVKLFGADLRGANMTRANLSEAHLMFTNLSSADLTEADLSDAFLFKANLKGAKLAGAKLIRADLTETNLEMANLFAADLTEAKLVWGTNMRGADLGRANLLSVFFELSPRSLPNIRKIATADNLSSLRFRESPHALVELREAFKKAGLRKQEREITYAIKHTERKILWKKKGMFNKIESLFNFILFEVTCQYGMSPGRLLKILLTLIIFFSIPYMIVLKRSSGDGIWKIWSSDRIRKDEGIDGPILLNFGWVHMLLIGLYFSLLSAFYIGWRELNVGNWITRMQPNEFILKATGWVRTVSGVQSLISVYLLALWLLTYFGRPFE
ncbi:MAG: pentapeptide repeat-containing protein [Candidatus Scalindua sp.]